MYKKLGFCLFLIFFLGGCGSKPHYKVVSRIDIAFNREHCYYDSPSKLEKFMYYLRSLETWGPAALDELDGTEYHITLTYSDGSTRSYRQKNSRCLAVNDGGWKKIRSETGEKLPLLLKAVPPDG